MSEKQPDHVDSCLQAWVQMPFIPKFSSGWIPSKLQGPQLTWEASRAECKQKLEWHRWNNTSAGVQPHSTLTISLTELSHPGGPLWTSASQTVFTPHWNEANEWQIEDNSTVAVIWTPSMKPIERQYQEPVCVMRKSFGWPPTISFKGVVVPADNFPPGRKWIKCCPHNLPPSQNSQVTGANEEPVVNSEHPGDQCSIIESVLIQQNTGEWLPQKSPCTWQGIDEIISFPFSCSLAKSSLAIYRGFNPPVDCPHSKTAGLKLALTWTWQSQGRTGRSSSLLLLLLQAKHLPFWEFLRHNLAPRFLIWNPVKSQQAWEKLLWPFSPSLLSVAWLGDSIPIHLHGT